MRNCQGHSTRRHTEIRLLLALVLCVSVIGFPQEEKKKPSDQEQKKQQDAFQIKAEVNMVTVPVTVRKPGGGFIKDLPKSAFRIAEDGEEQEILMFAPEAVPTRIAIVLDISGSVRNEWGSIKFSTKKFLENLKPEDEFSLVTFNTEVRLKMDWGRKFDRVDPVLTSVYCKDNTKLWDAIYVTANEVFKGVKEKKAMIIMSDGLDNESSVTYEEALQAAVRSEAAIYVVSKTEAVRQLLKFEMGQQRIYDNIPSEVFMQADLALRKLAYETGGRVLYPNSFGQLGDIYAEVDDELRNQYTLGYVSSNQLKDGSYRRIQVLVDSPGCQVSARPGYYAPNEIPTSQK